MIINYLGNINAALFGSFSAATRRKQCASLLLPSWNCDRRIGILCSRWRFIGLAAILGLVGSYRFLHFLGRLWVVRIMPSTLELSLLLSFIPVSFRLLLRTSWVFSALWRLFADFGRWTLSSSRWRPSCRWIDAFVCYLDWISSGIAGKGSINLEHTLRFALYFPDWFPWCFSIRRYLPVLAVGDSLAGVAFAGVAVGKLYLYTLFLDNFVRVDCIDHSCRFCAGVCNHF